MSDTQAILAKLSKQIEALGPAPPTTDDPPPKYDAGNAVDVEAIEKTLESPETQRLLKDEIAKLGNAAQDVEIAFRNVSRGLAKIVTMAKDGKLGEDPKKSKKLGDHKTTWDNLHKKYVELVWESRRVAGNARAIALDFAGDFIDVITAEEYSIEDKKQEIAAYRQELEKDMKNAENLSQSFIHLHDDVAAFRQDLKDDVKAWGQEVAKKLNTLLDDIEKVEKQLEQAKNTAIKAAIGGVGLGVAAGVVTAIGVFCPLLWFASAAMLGVAAAAGIYAGYKYYQLVQKRDGLKKQLEEHTKAAETMSQIIGNVGDLENDMVFIQQKLAIFASVWTIIHSDLNGLEKELDLASTSKGKLLFQKRIKTVSTGYKTLAFALRLYETNVHIKHSE